MVDVGYPRRTRVPARPRRAAAATRSRRGLGAALSGAVLLILALVFGQSGLIDDALNRIADAFGPAPTEIDVGAGTTTSVPAIAFAICGSRNHADCVIDGDTFYVGTDSIRVADIDTPEISQPGCASEEALGQRAKLRFLALLNQGSFELSPYDNRDVDQYGRKLRIVSRDGRSLGDQLVAEGLARTWTGSRQPWCT